MKPQYGALLALLLALPCGCFTLQPPHACSKGKTLRRRRRSAEHLQMAAGSSGSGKNKAVDKDMKAAIKSLQKMEKRKETKRINREERRLAKEAGTPGHSPNSPFRLKAKGSTTKSAKVEGESAAPSHFHVTDISGIDFMGSFAEDTSTWPDTRLPEVAFLGRSNVGKSSLLNCLFGERVAKVSKTPGRTQMINMFLARGSNSRPVCCFADLPGYGYAKVGKDDQRTIETFLMRYLYGRDQLKLLVLLVDCRRQPLEADAAILNFAADNDLGFHVAVVATKVDKLSPMDRALNLSRIRDGFELPDQLPIPFSAVSGEGKNEVWQYIKDACNAREAKRDLKPPPFGLK